MLKLNYVYDVRDLPTRITESDQTGVVATTDFVYDTRGRLITVRRSYVSAASNNFFRAMRKDQCKVISRAP